MRQRGWTAYPLPRAFAKRGNKFNRYLGDARAPRSSLYPCVCSASTGSLLTPDRRVRFLSVNGPAVYNSARLLRAVYDSRLPTAPPCTRSARNRTWRGLPGTKTVHGTRLQGPKACTPRSPEGENRTRHAAPGQSRASWDGAPVSVFRHMRLGLGAPARPGRRIIWRPDGPGRCPEGVGRRDSRIAPPERCRSRGGRPIK